MNKILIIEPDKLLSNIYDEFFTSKKYKIMLANNAKSLLEKIDTFKPDLIILEMQIANHSGVELLHEIRSYSDWKNIKIIIDTYVHPSKIGSIVDFKYKFKVDEYFYKPTTSLSKLFNSVQDSIAKR